MTNEEIETSFKTPRSMFCAAGAMYFIVHGWEKQVPVAVDYDKIMT